jgi:CelD/BcsL family acetyltransferase involved in cellulose biosynthesis
MTTIKLVRPAELSASDWQLWSDLQERNPALESPYFRPEFTQAVAAVRDDVEIAALQAGGITVGFFPFQRGSLGIGKPVGGKLSDYHGPIAAADAVVDPLALVRQCKLAGWDFDHLIAQPAFEPFSSIREESPYLELGAGYDPYCKGRRAAGSDVVAKTNQKARKCEREVGPLEFQYDCPDDELFATLRRWKSAQYERTGLADVFSFGWTIELLEQIRRNQTVGLSCPISVLRVAGRPACIALSLRAAGVLHCWFIAYEPEIAQYSPGLIFFLRFAEAAAGLGIRRIDLGKGDERYKWSLASGGIPVWEGIVGAGSLPLRLRGAWRQTRDWVNRSPLKPATELPARLIKPLRQWLAYH